MGGFREQEVSSAYAVALALVVRGIPQALYVAATASSSASRAGRSRWRRSWPGATCHSVRAGVVELAWRIEALSPQAKGRVERLWGTFQDRLSRSCAGG